MTDRIEEREPERAAEVAREDVDLTCDNCGAPVTWDPETDALSCAHCGHVTLVERGEGLVVERPLSAAGDAARGFGVELRVVRCQTCDARVTFEGAQTAGRCVFCGSASVLAQEASRNQLRPESLIPLDVGRAKVEERFRAWLKGLWFRPSALKRQKDFQARGVYVPAWTFDCTVDSEWSADSGTYYWVTQPTVVVVNGKPRVHMRQVRKIRWRPAWGERRDTYDDLQVLASAGIRGDLALKLGAYDTRALVPYRPHYLAGWHAEEYQVDLEEGWRRALARVEATQHRRCAGDVPGDTHRNLRVRNRVRDVYWKHALLPLWTLSYTFGGKTYPVLVHGQSGKVVGKAPWSWAKIGLGVLALLFALGVAMLFAAL